MVSVTDMLNFSRLLIEEAIPGVLIWLKLAALWLIVLLSRWRWQFWHLLFNGLESLWVFCFLLFFLFDNLFKCFQVFLWHFFLLIKLLYFLSSSLRVSCFQVSLLQWFIFFVFNFELLRSDSSSLLCRYLSLLSAKLLIIFIYFSYGPPSIWNGQWLSCLWARLN